MNYGLVILVVILSLVLLLVRSVKPERSTLSRFELARLVKLRNEAALLMQAREREAPVLVSLQRILALLLLTGLAWTLYGLCGVMWGNVMLVVVIVWGSALESAEPITRLARAVYGKLEPRLLAGVRKHHRILRIIPRVRLQAAAPAIHSEPELLHILQKEAPFLSEAQRAVIVSGLAFESQTVGDYMRVRRTIKPVEKGDVLGPLLLDELSRTGHTSFPVIDGDVDHVIGVLDIEKLISLEHKSTPNALQSMNPSVFFVDEDESLPNALRLILSEKAPFLIVQRGTHETAGIIGVKDMIRALIPLD